MKIQTVKMAGNDDKAKGDKIFLNYLDRYVAFVEDSDMDEESLNGFFKEEVEVDSEDEFGDDEDEDENDKGQNNARQEMEGKKIAEKGDEEDIDGAGGENVQQIEDNNDDDSRNQQGAPPMNNVPVAKIFLDIQCVPCNLHFSSKCDGVMHEETPFHKENHSRWIRQLRESMCSCSATAKRLSHKWCCECGRFFFDFAELVSHAATSHNLTLKMYAERHFRSLAALTCFQCEKRTLHRCVENLGEHIRNKHKMTKEEYFARHKTRISSLDCAMCGVTKEDYK